MFKDAILILILGLAGLISGCDNGARHTKMPSKDMTSREQQLEQLIANPSQIDYPVVAEILEANKCVGCHNTDNKKANVDLSSYESLFGEGNLSKTVVEPSRAQDSSLFQVLKASGGRQMPPPPSPRLTDTEQLIVYHWINQGAKLEVTDQEAGHGEEDSAELPTHISEELQEYFKNPQTIDFEVVDKHVFATSCNDCHSTTGSKPDDEAINSLDLTDYKSMFFSVYGVPFVKGKPYSTGAYQTVAFDQSMPPTEDGYRLLDPYRAKLLRLWIL
ncbi:MAG: c-type cytochrome domain-containing protein, partial [Pseudomonadota bacterium]